MSILTDLLISLEFFKEYIWASFDFFSTSSDVAIANTLRASLQAIALAFAFKACLPDGRYRWPLSIHYPLGPSKEKRS